MKGWRTVVIVGVILAGVIILATAFLETAGRYRLPWPPMAHQLGAPRWGVLSSAPVLSAGAYIEALAGLASQFLIGVLILYTAPARVRRLADGLSAGARATLRYFLIGLVLALALGAVGLLSAFFVQTVPMPFILGVIYFIAAMVGAVAAGFALGRTLLRRAGWAHGSPLIALLLGTTLLYAALRIPFLAPALIAFLGLLGAGAALSTRFGGRQDWSLDPLREVPEV